MKTITLDWETYQLELSNEYRKGSNSDKIVKACELLKRTYSGVYDATIRSDIYFFLKEEGEFE